MQQVFEELHEHLGVAAGRIDDLPGHQGENEEGHGLHHHPDHADEHFVQAIDGPDEGCGLLLGHAHEYHAEKDREEDDLQHRHVGQGAEDVGRHHVDQWLQWSGRLGAFRLVELVHHPIVHGHLFLCDGLNLGGQCRIRAQADVVEHLDAVGVPPQLIADAVGLEQVVRYPGAGLEEIDEHETDNHRGHGGEEVGDDGFDPEPAEFGRVAEACNT